jgi:hypothetical protein
VAARRSLLLPALSCAAFAALAVGSITFAAGCSGGGAEAGCASGESCGGDPTGSWKVQNACQYVPALAYTTSTLYPPQTMPQTPKLAKPPPSNKASGDWCSELVYLPPDPKVPDFPKGKVTNVNLYYPPAPLNYGTIIFSSDHTYQTGIAVDSPYTTHFAPACITAHGATPTCTDLAEQIFNFYVPMPNYTDITCCAPGSTAGHCLPDASNGCDCSYSYRTVNADMGSWRTSDDILYLFSGYNAMQPMIQTTYCARGGQLSMSGRDGQSLFNIMGLRTLVLSRDVDAGAM